MSTTEAEVLFVVQIVFPGQEVLFIVQIVFPGQDLFVVRIVFPGQGFVCYKKLYFLVRVLFDIKN